MRPISKLVIKMEYSEPESSLLTPIPHNFKVQDAVKLQYLQDTGQSQNRDPTEKELCQCILLIKERFPECRLDRIIQLLHDTLLKEEQEQRRKRMSLLLQTQDDYLSDEDVTELEKKRMQQEYARKFQNSDANPRFYQEREIAKLFCSKGYGYPTAREYLGQNITPNRYNNVITTIVRLSYRKLEYFIIKNLNPRLPMISREQLKMIKTPLVNCRNWMTQRQADNFHRFVKLTYKIPTDDPQKEIALQLHQSIMTQLKKRNVTYKHHRRGQEHAGWTSQMEQNLIVQYSSNTNIQEIQRQLMLLHPASRSAFEIGRLKLKLDRLIRFAVKKVNIDRQKFGITESSQISEYLTNKIIRTNNGQHSRIRLLTYYLDRDRNAMKVRWVFEVIKQFLELNKQTIEEIQDSSCQVIPKQELKAQEIQGQPKEELGKKEEEEKENSPQQLPQLEQVQEAKQSYLHDE